MAYQDLTRDERKTARAILERLREHGVMESVSQVAVHFEDARAWAAGSIPLTTLLVRTGWKRTVPAKPAEQETYEVELPLAVLRHIRDLLTEDGTEVSEGVLLFLPTPSAVDSPQRQAWVAGTESGHPADAPYCQL